VIRPAVVAGRFYPGDPRELESYLAGVLAPRPPVPEKALAAIVPHAGYPYSGGCAAAAFRRLAIPRTVVIAGVNHHGIGHPLAVDDHQAWQTPLGPVALDREWAEKLVTTVPLFAFDATASRHEHSLEVQVPFLRFLRADVRLVPVTVACHDAAALLQAGTALGRLVANDPDILLVASTDMSHYIPAAAAARLDRQAIAAIEALDPAALFATVARLGISMCGVAPTTLILAAAVAAGARTVETVCYTHSGVVTGDDREVVAYYSALVR
jgi:MEMO1 family protein